ncbi:hypothetical protein BG58_31330 [Caballeronia jiangsuensis]|nr:hypothetical protein BG58_31330 [Caballeronia jiangsuensis]
MAGYVYGHVEDQEKFASGFARLTNALIAAGSRGDFPVFHPDTLLPYDLHNAGFEDDQAPIGPSWVANIDDVLHWLATNNVEAASPFLKNVIVHSEIRAPVPVDRRTEMLDALQRNGGNKTKTAKEFGISRQRLTQITSQNPDTSSKRKGLALVPQDPFGIGRKAK